MFFLIIKLYKKQLYILRISSMKKEMITTIICSTIAMLCCFLFFYLEVFYESNMYLFDYVDDWDTHIVASIDDDIQANTMWCWTFQLVWNDMVNNVVKQDIVFNPQLKVAENLNKQTFTTEQLSPSWYFTKFWLFTLDIKRAIEDWIREKFNEKSDLLNLLDRSEAPQSDEWWENKKPKMYIFYAMLKKVFNFKYKFDVLDSWLFDGKYGDVKYFWINGKSSNNLRWQVTVLYYNSKNDFAVSLKTNEWEDVILQRWTNWISFNDTYLAVIEKAKKSFWWYLWEYDYLKVPKLSLAVLKEYEDFYDKEFLCDEIKICEIKKAYQTIEFDLDEKWWKIKSEALVKMQLRDGISMHHEDPEYRYFYFDKPFMIFLKESDKELPYFAAQITNVKLFQK